MGIFERGLSLWVALCMALGVTLGSLFPAVFSVIAGFEYAHVNGVIAVLIWLMIIPMMLQIEFSAIKQVGENPKGLLLTLLVNWLIKPFTMALLGWLFFRVVFSGWVDVEAASEYIAGMILLGVAPCTAMVFVWSQLSNGNPNYTLVQVSVNDVIMVFAFAPIAALLLGVSDINVPWKTLLLSVALYVVLPLIVGIVVRQQKNGQVDGLVAMLKPFSMLALFATIVLLFAFQAQTILAKPQHIVLIAIPLLVQSIGIFALAYWAAHYLRLQHSVAAPAALIGTSNFFELAVAVAISLFGLQSGAALATVVGVLVEVPVMLLLVAFANRTRHWFDADFAPN